MGIYSIILLLSFVFAISNLFIKKSRDRIFLLIIFFLLFAISAIRVNVGADYIHMRDDVFYQIGGSFSGGTYVESGYSFLNALLYNLFFGKYHSLLILSALLYTSVFYFLIKYLVEKRWRPYSAFLYIGTGIFFATLNLTRQYWAISLVIIAFLLFIKYKDEKKPVLSCILPLALICLASTFHLSSLISLLFIPFFYLAKGKHGKKVFIALLILSAIVMVVDIRNIISLVSSILPGRWQWYMGSSQFTGRNISAIVKQIPILIMAIYALVRYSALSKKNKHFHAIATTFFLSAAISNIGFGVMVLIRLSYYFDFAVLLLLPIILTDIKDWLGNKYYYVGLTCSSAYYIALTVTTVFVMNGQGVMPYSSLLGGF